MLNIIQMRETLSDRNIRSVVLGASTSSVATLTFSILVSIYVMQLTGSAMELGLVLAIGTLPFVFLSAFAGVLCDRSNKKNIFIYADLIRVVIGVFVVIVLNFISKDHHVMILYFMVFIYSVIEVFSTNSFHSIIPSVVDKEKILDANVVFSGLIRMSPIISPMIGVFLYSLVGLEWSILIISMIYLISYFLEKDIRYSPERIKKTQSLGKIIRDEISSFAYLIRNDMRVTSLNVNGFATHLVLIPFILIGLPYLIIHSFNGDPSEYGIVEMFAAIGTLLSVFIVPTFKNYGSAINLLIGMGGMFLGSILFLFLLNADFNDILADSQLYRVAFFSLVNFIIFFSFGFYGVFFASFLHENIEPKLLGKGMAIQLTLIGAGRFIGFLVFSYLFTISLEVSISILILGMFMKFIIHIPFIIKDTKLNADKEITEPLCKSTT